jgi:hypothetical protein
VVLQVDDGQVNARLVILGARNDVAIELTPPGQEIRYGEIVSWPFESAASDVLLTVLELQAVSTAPDWPCVSAREVRWDYDRNFYRLVTPELNTNFTNVDSLGCHLLEQEPLFSLAPAEAIGIIESSLLDYGFEAEGAERALLTLAMLYVMQGRLDDARTTAQSVIPAGDEASWTARQGTALLQATGVASNTALDICEAMALASESPACDMNAVLGRYLAALDLSSNSDLVEQLENAGLPVFEAVRRNEIGKAQRVVVSFMLADTEWWGFFEERDGTIRFEPAAPPEGFDEAVFPQAQVSVPQAAFDALFVDNSPTSALNILDNLELENPDVPFRPEGLYLRALSYDLTNSREEARTGYYDVWLRYADTVWGQLASEHLVQR